MEAELNFFQIKSGSLFSRIQPVVFMNSGFMVYMAPSSLFSWIHHVYKLGFASITRYLFKDETKYFWYDLLPPLLLSTLLLVLKNLKELWLFDCPELKRLPNSSGLLTELREFKIQNCLHWNNFINSSIPSSIRREDLEVLEVDARELRILQSHASQVCLSFLSSIVFSRKKNSYYNVSKMETRILQIAHLL